jgi:DNA polymerase-3 subunit delta'
VTDSPQLAAERAGVDLWSGVVGQPEAIDMVRSASRAPVHAYLLVGPRGSGKRALAHAFAAALLSEGRPQDEVGRHATLALAGSHPDLMVVEREGAAISAEQIGEILATSVRSSMEGGRRVLVLDEFHLIGNGAPKLLKSIEEPPAGTVFIVLADDVPAELITIASRCVRIDLGTVATGAIAERLISDGIDPQRAADAAASANGDLGRARLLATDERLALRREAWWSVPDRLDGTGSTTMELVDSLLGMIEDAMAPLVAVQELESEELAEIIKARGERGSGRKQLESKHKRQARRHRTDEIRFGLGVLSGRYRDDMLTSARPDACIDAIGAIAALAAELVRNPNERLQLAALFGRLARPDLR